MKDLQSGTSQVPKSPSTKRNAILLVTVILLGGLLLLLASFELSKPRVNAVVVQESRPSGLAAPGATLSEPLEVLVKAANKAANAEPENAAAQIHAADLCADQGNFTEAIHYYTRALALHPDDVAVRTDLGTAYWYAGSPEKAMEQYKISLAKRPNDPSTLFNMGFIRMEALKDRTGAVQAWKQLLDTNPSFAQRKRVLELIAEAEKH